ncbi:MAG: CPBP family intramembrane metalloprotease [Bacteroidales bacterium]|nr:CPBP family intramembrane metalloprotease [Bacteroidales bacterium]
MDINENVVVPSRKPRLFRWALWWGLGVIVTSLVALIVYASINPDAVNEMNAPLMKAIYSMVCRFGVWPVIIYMGLVGPIIEELSFRLWGNGKNWTGIVSVILMALWCFNVGWWFSLLALSAGVAILMIFKEDRTKRLFVLMLFSSVLFAVAHMGNYDGNWFVVLLGVLHKLGFGLLASYLVVNHNILWSMGLHIINNSIVVLPLVLTMSQTNIVETIENDNFSLEIRPVLVHNDSISEDKNFFADTDTNYYFGNTSNFAGQAWIYEAWQNGIDPNGDSVNIVTDDAYPNCSFKLVYKTRLYDHHGLIVAMEHAGFIKIDTTYNEIDKKTVLDIKSTYDPLSKNR